MSPLEHHLYPSETGYGGNHGSIASVIRVLRNDGVIALAGPVSLEVSMLAEHDLISEDNKVIIPPSLLQERVGNS